MTSIFLKVSIEERSEERGKRHILKTTEIDVVNACANWRLSFWRQTMKEADSIDCLFWQVRIVVCATWQVADNVSLQRQTTVITNTQMSRVWLAGRFKKCYWPTFQLLGFAFIWFFFLVKCRTLTIKADNSSRLLFFHLFFFQIQSISSWVSQT